MRAARCGDQSATAEVWKRVFDANSDEPPPCQGPPPRKGRKRGARSQAIGPSKGGMSTKSWHSPMRSAISFGSCCCLDSASTPSAFHRSSKG